MNEDIVNAGFDSSAQSPEVNPDITTPAAQPSQSENPAVEPDQQPEPDPAQVLWQTLQEDPNGTISFLVQHYGWQPNMYPNRCTRPSGRVRIETYMLHRLLLWYNAVAPVPRDG